MLFGEPARTQADLNFSLGGTPVRIHPFFWLIGLFMGPMDDGVREMALWLAAFSIGILAHEMGHALTMRAFGFRPWVILYGLGGMAIYDPRTTWNSRGNSTLRQILISAAGPAAGFLIAGIIIGAMLMTGHSVTVEFGFPYGISISPNSLVISILVTKFIYYFLFITVVYGVLNLLPIYPLDGGQITRELCLWCNAREGIRWSLIFSIIFSAALAALFAKAALQGNQHGDWFPVFLFGYLAFNSYSIMQAYEQRRP